MFYDAFQDDVERKVYDEGVRVRVRKWLQELEKTFYGNALSYDKAMELGGGELTKALHRNVFDGQGDERHAKALERYVRHQATSLALTPTQAVMDGRIRFTQVKE
jgi:cytochrome b pre-mRNA-processing protein 3